MDVWVCMVCSKRNDPERMKCAVCGRSCRIGRTSEAVEGAKPRALHGTGSLYTTPKQLEQMVTDGLDVNSRDTEGWTPLISACRAGAKDIVTTLLRYDVDVCARTKDGWMAIHYAAELGYACIVDILLNDSCKDSIINAPTLNTRYTALHIAAMHGHVETIRVLAGKLADLNSISQHLKQTPLHFAVSYQQFNAVSALLHLNADPHILDSEQLSAYETSILFPCERIRSLLQNYEDANQLTNDKRLEDVLNNFRHDRMYVHRLTARNEKYNVTSQRQ